MNQKHLPAIRTSPGHLGSVLKRAHGKISRILHQAELPANQDDLRLCKLRWNRKRHRCFIIGNGPSLSADDLERIADEDSMACNRIFLIYPHTRWRPTYYLAVDRKVIAGIHDQIPGCEGTRILSSRLCDDLLPRGKAYARFVEKRSNGPLTRLEDDANLVDSFAFSTNALRGIEAGWATLYLGIQLAYWFGYDDVVMLGVDHSYPKNLSGDPSDYRPDGTTSSHFSKEYVRPDLPIDEPNLRMTTAAFAKAAQVFAGSGKRLLNASRKTCLKTVPRMTLEEVLSDKG